VGTVGGVCVQIAPQISGASDFNRLTRFVSQHVAYTFSIHCHLDWSSLRKVYALIVLFLKRSAKSCAPRQLAIHNEPRLYGYLWVFSTMVGS
jgi:hypothetical protein